VVVHDPRGVSVTLSHYCPTAASLLESDTPGLKVRGSWMEPRTFRSGVSIIESPLAFPSSGEYVGLDARESLPPLLRPGVLMDWESWWETERLAVDLLANSAESAATALGRLRAVVNRLGVWRPGTGPLLDHVRASFAEAPARPALSIDARDRRREVVDAVPHDLDLPAASNGTIAEEVLKRFLAAHAFANWAVHLGDGLAAWVRSIEAAYALIASGWDTRQADLILRHLADPAALARPSSG
jgi:hypothetical protein